MTSLRLARQVADLALTKKAYDIVLLDLRKLGAVADFFVVCSADSDTQVKAIADAIRDGAKSMNVMLWHTEGMRALRWVLLDFVDVVVHIFHREARSFYRIEKLWSDAAATEVQETVNQDESPRISASRRSTPKRGSGPRKKIRKQS